MINNVVPLVCGRTNRLSFTGFNFKHLNLREPQSIEQMLMCIANFILNLKVHMNSILN
jgi:hypothetical protein